MERRYRMALAVGGYTTEEVAAYLPANYQVLEFGATDLLIVGYDDAGWTLDDYVIPRLASGLYFFEEVT